MSLNVVHLYGNLTRDVELRTTPKGTSVGKAGLAINERWKGDDGELRNQTVFVNFTCWGSTAEVMAQHLKMGDPVLVSGKLKSDSWTDKETGEKRNMLSVTVEFFTFTNGKKSGEAAGPSPGTPPAARSVPSSKTAPCRA